MKNKLKTLLVMVSIAIMMTLSVGCSQQPTEMADREGNTFTIPKEINKIISTAPSNTEVLVELGLSDKLIAIDQYSSDVEGIDENLTKIDFTNPDAETIIALEPDIIIASGHNRVGDEDPFALLKEAGITVVYIPSSSSIDGICEDIEFIATVTGTEKEGADIVSSIKAEVEEIKEIGNTIADKKSVYFEIGAYDSLYTFGYDTFLNEFIEVVGAENIFKDQEAWISVTPEAVLEANPDVIIVNTPGVNENGETAVEAVKTREGWDTITAVKDGAVYMVDSNESSRPSHKAVKALKAMAKAIYPDEYKEIQE